MTWQVLNQVKITAIIINWLRDGSSFLCVCLANVKQDIILQVSSYKMKLGAILFYLVGVEIYK